jgi:hypothetical protein
MSAFSSVMAVPAFTSVMQVKEAEAPAVVHMPPVVVQAAPQCHHAAGSCGVPVFGTSVAVPIAYQQPNARKPTTAYCESSGLSHEQMKTIFPLGFPEAFQPHDQTRCAYNIVQSPEQCLPVAATHSVVDSRSLVATPLAAEAGTPAPALDNAIEIETGTPAPTLDNATQIEAGTPTPALGNATQIEACAAEKPVHDDFFAASA